MNPEKIVEEFGFGGEGLGFHGFEGNWAIHVSLDEPLCINWTWRTNGADGTGRENTF
jgi:hypothetical protein